MIALSVISMHSVRGFIESRASSFSSLAGRSWSSRSRVDRLIANFRSSPCARNSPLRAAQRSIIQPVSTRMKPVCSANGMKRIGATMPRVGCCQRTSASAPSTPPVASETLGCRNRRSWSWSTAVRSSLSSDSDSWLAESRLGSYTRTPDCRALAAYIATSARPSSVSGSAPWAG